MVDKEKLIAYINSTKVTKVYSGENARHKWEGFIPEGVDLVAPESNTFSSAKNIKTFTDMVNGIESVRKPASVEEKLTPTLQEVVEKYDVVTDEVAKIKSRGPRKAKAVE